MLRNKKIIQLQLYYCITTSGKLFLLLNFFYSFDLLSCLYFYFLI